MGDNVVLKEIKDIMKRERESKGIDKPGKAKEYVDLCGLCKKVISGRQTSVECTKCKLWIHLKCSKCNNYKEARDNKDRYECINCENRNDTAKTELLESN